MAIVNINTKEATVTKIHPFRTAQGYGADVFMAAQSDAGTVYLEVSVYDEQADAVTRELHTGDAVDVTGVLTFKSYPRKDGGSGYSMMVRKPALLVKHMPDGRTMQLVPCMPAACCAGFGAAEPACAVPANAVPANAVPARAPVAPDDDDLPF